MDFLLQNKRALVCGASQGIGAACALRLAQLGARVLLLARSEDKLKKLVAELPRIPTGSDKNNRKKNDGGHNYLAVDFEKLEALKNKFSARVHDFSGGFDILICNTGGPKSGSLLEADSAEFARAFEMHVLVNSYLAQTLIPEMKKNKYGRIINIISTSVKAPIPNLGVSNTVRGAVANWAKTLSLEVAGFGITVNNVLPGYTQTPRLKALAKAAAEKQNVSVSEIEKQWLKQIPAGRFAESREIADAVAFLASPLAAYINGINLPVDGGRTPSL